MKKKSRNKNIEENIGENTGENIRKNIGQKNTGTRMMRLDRLLAQEGFGTRSEIKKAIRSGRAAVNGTVEKDPGRQISSDDEIRFDDKVIARAEFVYYMLYKPAGVITATEDSRTATVLDLLRAPESSGNPRSELQPEFSGNRMPEIRPFSPEGRPSEVQQSSSESSPSDSEPDRPFSGLSPSDSEPDRPFPGRSPADSEPDRPSRSAQPVLRRDLFPVGRLDKDTEGLLLITDDGQLAHRLLSPGRHVDKVYYAVVTGQVTEEDRRRFAEGFCVDESLKAMPARLLSAAEAARETEQLSGLIPEDPQQLIPPGTTSFSPVLVTIREGKFHQIKRMFAAVGKEVLYLRRLSMGPLLLDEALSPGEFRELTEEEIRRLRET